MGWGIPSKTLVNVLLIASPAALSPPWALTPPLISQDFGTSRRQLTIERYTKFPRLPKGKGGVMAGYDP
jgi:hypothetical protein